jgi:hypothetical protein
VPLLLQGEGLPRLPQGALTVSHRTEFACLRQLSLLAVSAFTAFAVMMCMAATVSSNMRQFFRRVLCLFCTAMNLKLHLFSTMRLRLSDVLFLCSEHAVPCRCCISCVCVPAAAVQHYGCQPVDQGICFCVECMLIMSFAAAAHLCSTQRFCPQLPYSTVEVDPLTKGALRMCVTCANHGMHSC